MFLLKTFFFEGTMLLKPIFFFNMFYILGPLIHLANISIYLFAQNFERPTLQDHQTLLEFLDYAEI